MQNHDPPPAPSAGFGTTNTSSAALPARQTTNNGGANLLSHPLKRLSLHTATNTPLLSSPGLSSPRRAVEPHRSPSSPNIPPLAIRRSASVASLNRSQSPALGRKSSTSSLRGDTPGTPRGALSRRSSLNPNMPSPIPPKSPLPPPLEEQQPLRACDVADIQFMKELERHDDATGTANAGTIVIVHDQCYGHRFSRPKTSKTTLSLIMERPERILASVLGISAAYVRLGERHAGGSHPPHPDHDPPERIPFKIRKTSRLVDITSPVVTNVHGTAWMSELKSLCDNAERKLASTGKELARDAPSLPGKAPKQELHAGDLYLCPESMNAFRGALGGVLDAVDAIFQRTTMNEGPSRAFVCIRPPGHHCSDDYPSGFCWLNNVHVGIEHAMMNYGLTHAAIIDFDLHHGDGSQAITWARNKKVQNMSKNTPNWKKTSIGYFSLHDINSYPCEEGDDDKVQAASLCIDNAHGQSIWNVHLQPWKTPEEFWAIYEEKYMVLLEKTRLYLKHHTNRLTTTPNHPAPKAAIFLSAGFDASEWETAGMQRHSVNVPTEFYARFTRDVVQLAEEEGTAVEGRVISVLEGGYSDRALASGVLSHLTGLCDGQVWTEPKPSKGLAFDMHQRLGGLSIADEDTPMTSGDTEPMPVTYDPLWWHPTQLSELESLVNPPPPVAPKKPRNGSTAHFSSPTQSFTAKVVDVSKLSRSMSGKYATSSSRAPTPPPPDVDWATATHALSKLLIPSDRQTRSCRPEDLAEQKVKKEKPAAPILASTHVDSSGRQLRGRKAAASYAESDSGEEKAPLRVESRSSRRKTIADFPLASAEPLAPSRTTTRRMSIASSVSSIGEKTTSRVTSATTSRRSVAPSTTATSTNGVAVKKPRAPASTTNSRGAPRPPVPRIPSNYGAKGTTAKGKENDDVDALTTGLKRITLKMPSKEEYEARQKEKEDKQKALEASKKTTAKTATRKTAAPRTSTSKAATKPTATKKGPGRPSKAPKAESPGDMKAASPLPEAPPLRRGASAPLQQPQPVQPDAGFLLRQSVLQQPITEPLEADRRASSGIIEPPTDLKDLAMTPEQLREQLPMPSFVAMTEPSRPASLPPRAETPPPPPPSGVAQFVNYTSQNFDATSKAGTQAMAVGPRSSTLPQWPPPTSHPVALSTHDSRSMSPARNKQDLPVFTAHGTIPFGSNPNAATSTSSATFNSMAGQHGAGTEIKKEESFQDVWEMPETRSG